MDKRLDYTGYKGYVPVPVREAKMPYAPVQGSRAFLDTKFHAPSRVEPPPDASLSAFNSSVFGLSAAGLKPEDFKKGQKQRELVILPMDKEVWIKTVNHAEVPDFPALAQQLNELATQTDALDRGFDAYDPKGEGFIVPSELRPALRTAMGGKEPVDFAVQLVENLATGKHELKRIPREAWHTVVREAGEWITAMLDSQTPVQMKLANGLNTRGGASATARLGSTGSAAPSARALAGASAGSITLSAGGSPREGLEAGAPQASQGEEDLANTVTFDAVAQASVRGGVDASSTSGSRRLLTAGPVGGVDLTLRGLHMGQMRQAQLDASAHMQGTAAHGSGSGSGSGPGAFKLVGPDVQSAFQRDVGDYGSNPRERDVLDPAERMAGHPQTTGILSAGTTKTSRHPPGYMGHVPQVTFGTAAEQGLGQTKRNTFHAKTDLAETYSRNIAGYMGHKPDYVLTGGTTLVKPRGPAAASDYDHGMGHIESYWASVRPPA